jgi:cytochrome P450
MTSDEKASHLIAYDHHTEKFGTNPWPIWQEQRQTCPVGYSESHDGFWVVTRYQDIVNMLRDWKTFSSVHEPGTRFLGQSVPPYAGRISFVEMDPPASLNYRKLVQPELSATKVEAAKPMIRAKARTRLEKFVATGEADLVNDYANQVPARVILDLLGLDEEAWEIWAGPSHTLSHATNGTPEFEEAVRGMGAAIAFSEKSVDDRLADPRDDFLSRIVHGTVDGQQISRDESVEMLYVLIMGGLETVTGVMANAMYYLAQNRAARDALLSSPELITSASEEFLRYYSPTRGFARTTTEDAEVGGTHIGPEERVLMVIGSANHDEEIFEDAETIKLDRSPNKHLTFGSGVHRCPGDRLARAELQIVLEELLRAAPDYDVDFANTIPYPRQPMTTGFISMPATLRTSTSGR